MATDIVLKDRNGQDVTYKGIETVTFDTPTEGEQATFTHGTVVDGVTVEPDFSEGDQVISVPEGFLVKETTISKPVELVPGNIRKGIDIGGVVGEFSGDTEERTVDLNFPSGATETDILPLITISGFALNSDYGAFVANGDTIYPLTVGETYMVVWDGEPYECTGQDVSHLMGDGVVGIGNGSAWGLEGNNEPFVILADGWRRPAYLSLTDTGDGGEHAVRIYQVTNGADMVVKPTAEGKSMTKVTVTKPEMLTSENVRKGIDVGGIIGSFIGDTEEATVDLDFTSGDQIVEPSAENKVLSKLTITQPETLVPENIAEGINIAGVVGSFAGGNKAVNVYTERLYLSLTPNSNQQTKILLAASDLPDWWPAAGDMPPYAYTAINPLYLVYLIKDTSRSSSSSYYIQAAKLDNFTGYTTSNASNGHLTASTSSPRTGFSTASSVYWNYSTPSSYTGLYQNQDGIGWGSYNRYGGLDGYYHLVLLKIDPY